MLGSAGEGREIGPGGSGLTDGYSLGTDEFSTWVRKGEFKYACEKFKVTTR